jgi:hypothetical protein
LSLHATFFPLTPIFGYVNYLEFLLTFSPNDTFLNSYYFWWTNSYYVIPFLISLSLFIVIYQLNYISISVVGVFYLIVETWLLEFWSVLQSNSQTIAISTLTPQINTLLTNALNKYHPFIFYLSLFLLIVLSFQFFTEALKYNRFRLSEILLLIKVKTVPIIVLNFTALYFGSWWAFQEGTWGGWWNWDPSEVFGLTPTLVLLILTHTHWTLTHISVLRIKLLSTNILILILYLLTQLNFELISHNFGPKFFYFFNSNLFSLSILILSLLVIFKGEASYKLDTIILLTYSQFYGKSPYTYFRSTYLQLAIFSIITLWVVTSYGLFFEYLLFSFFKSITSFTNIIYQTNMFLLLTLIVLFMRPKFTPFIPLATSWSVTNLTSSLYLENRSGKLHYLTLLFTLINVSVYNSTLFNWFITPVPSEAFTDNQVIFDFPLVSVCDSWSTDEIYIWSDSTGIISTNWSTSDLTNINVTNRFLLFFNTSNIYNYYSLALTYVDVILVLNTPLLPSVSILAWAAIYVFLKTRN